MDAENPSTREFRSDPKVLEALRAMREREAAMSKLLMAFITSGLVFMLFPGTLLGVWNLLQISGRDGGFLGVGCAAAGHFGLATALLSGATVSSILAIRIFEASEQEAKIRGIHESFPVFVRMAYGWLLIAAALCMAASQWDTSGGFWGASRHALTVGFVGTMILAVGQRILPAFAGMRLLWSPRLMFLGLALLAFGCTLRVSCEVLAYQGYAAWAWHVLPASALLELTALTVFATNMLCTFVLQKTHAVNEPMMVGVPQLATVCHPR